MSGKVQKCTPLVLFCAFVPFGPDFFSAKAVQVEDISVDDADIETEKFCCKSEVERKGILPVGCIEDGQAVGSDEAS